jgi:hypothetical protein
MDKNGQKWTKMDNKDNKEQKIEINMEYLAFLSGGSD